MRNSTELMRRRGPDAGGSRRCGPALLGFRRLAIIDLSPNGNQPMSNEHDDIWAVFNGEIYNFPELRRDLEDRHRFRSSTDTEVLLHGYEEWGFEGLLRRIDGMFAFALWDEREEVLYLARDRVGKKPLYYAEAGESVAFASSVNALLALLPHRPAIDPVALDEYLVYQAVPAPKTIYSGVSMLLPAHYARWRREKRLDVARYWDLSYAAKKPRREADLLAELDGLVRAAVQRRLVSDVPLGAFLSGGVDSSLVVSVMSALMQQPVEAVTIGFDDPAYDERPLAREVALRSGACLREHVLRADEVQHLPEIIWHYGQPLADVSIVPTFAVARAAREHVTVVLNGDGGDEAFGGYARPVLARSAETYRATVPHFLQPVGARLAGCAGRRGRMLARTLQTYPRRPATYNRGLRNLRAALYSPDYLGGLRGSHPDAHYSAVWERADGPTDADRALFVDLSTYLPDQLLVKMDVSTMAHSVEARSPLLDTRVLEFAATIPAAQLIKGYRTKYLLKRLAERYVPGHILYRRKRGFVIPAAQWLRRDLAPYARALLAPPAIDARGYFQPSVVRRMLEEHLAGVQDWGEQLWTLMVLEIWFRLFVDGTLSRHDRLEAVL